MNLRRRIPLTATLSLSLALCATACEPEARPFERPAELEVVEVDSLEEQRRALRERQERESDEDPYAKYAPTPTFVDRKGAAEVVTVERPESIAPRVEPVKRDPLLDALDARDARDAEERRIAKWKEDHPPTVTYEKVYPKQEPREEYRPDPDGRIREAARADGIERETGYAATDSSGGRNLDDTSGSRVYTTQDSPAPERQVKPFIPGLPAIPGLPSIGKNGPTAEGLSEKGSSKARATVSKPGARRAGSSVVVKP